MGVTDRMGASDPRLRRRTVVGPRTPGPRHRGSGRVRRRTGESPRLRCWSRPSTARPCSGGTTAREPVRPGRAPPARLGDRLGDRCGPDRVLLRRRRRPGRVDDPGQSGPGRLLRPTRGRLDHRRVLGHLGAHPGAHGDRIHHLLGAAASLRGAGGSDGCPAGHGSRPPQTRPRSPHGGGDRNRRDHVDHRRVARPGLCAGVGRHLTDRSDARCGTGHGSRDARDQPASRSRCTGWCRVGRS